FTESHEAWEKEAELLAVGLINIISNHSPDKIIMGGGVMDQKQLFPMIRHNVEKVWNNYTPLISLSDLISEPGLGVDSGIVGSLSLILN
ncbi:MAG: ROK family protein, partial [Candidatus Poseidoniia archaeon]|nr:ROK family protein [Candidatus Poseidoniia archaeon]